MQLTRNLGLLVLSVWLILAGLLPLLNLRFPASGVILALLAIAAGVLLLVGPARQSQKRGLLVLAIWLIATGLAAFLPALQGLGLLLSLLAIAAGVLILLTK
jgi:hypothetical protein